MYKEFFLERMKGHLGDATLSEGSKWALDELILRNDVVLGGKFQNPSSFLFIFYI